MYNRVSAVRRGIKKMGRLDGKVAIITGAGSGMGRAAALLFAKEGAKVVVADWVAGDGEETVRMVKEAGGEAIFVQTDVSKAEDVKKMVKTAVDTYGKLDVLFNNAGIAELEMTPTPEIKEENWDKVIAINLKGVFLGMKYAIPEMLKSGGGSIINTASGAAVQPLPGIASYNASKGGVISLTRGTALEYARKNIRVNYINPGPTVSRLNPQWVTEIWEKHSASGRLANPEEIAQAALFLASDESSHVTASGVTVDGGQTASGAPNLMETS